MTTDEERNLANGTNRQGKQSPDGKTAQTKNAIPESVPEILHFSPFVKKRDDTGVSWSFEAEGPGGEKIVACVHPGALFQSLVATRGDEELLVCGCSVGGCAGFFDESFEATDRWIEWRTRYYDLKCVWRFDRTIYETEAIRMLRDIHDTREGWNFCYLWYDSLDAFEAAVADFLAANPRFRPLWDAAGQRPPE
jgi:hypothetical protein